MQQDRGLGTETKRTEKAGCSHPSFLSPIQKNFGNYSGQLHDFQPAQVAQPGRDARSLDLEATGSPRVRVTAGLPASRLGESAMPECYLGEILAVSFNFVPQGWLACDGKLYSIAEHTALAHLLGTKYGGDGINNFAVPDLRGRVPISQGQAPAGTSYTVGQTGGVEQVTLLASQVGPHSHALNASTQVGGYWPPKPYPPPKGTPPAPGPGMALAISTQPAVGVYGNDEPYTSLAGSSIRPAGQSVPHENRQPFLAINYIICSSGVFPQP
jgi:microcystin-dependent protein